MILLNYSDGTFSLEELAVKYNIDYSVAFKVAEILEKNKLIKKL